MPKASNHSATRKRRKRVLRQAKGYFGNKSRLYRYAIDQVDRSGVYAYNDRRKNKSNFRKLWIVRINAACRAEGIAYSRFINGLSKLGIGMDRKALAELAVSDEVAFKALIDKVKGAIAA